MQLFNRDIQLDSLWTRVRVGVSFVRCFVDCGLIVREDRTLLLNMRLIIDGGQHHEVLWTAAPERQAILTESEL
jgi:hypothetical protein